jgi:hypothetical protein
MTSHLNEALIIPCSVSEHIQQISIVCKPLINFRQPMVPEMIVLAADVLLCDLVQEGEALCLIQF